MHLLLFDFVVACLLLFTNFLKYTYSSHILFFLCLYFVQIFHNLQIKKSSLRDDIYIDYIRYFRNWIDTESVTYKGGFLKAAFGRAWMLRDEDECLRFCFSSSSVSSGFFTFWILSIMVFLKKKLLRKKLIVFKCKILKR